MNNFEILKKNIFSALKYRREQSILNGGIGNWIRVPSSVIVSILNITFFLLLICSSFSLLIVAFTGLKDIIGAIFTSSTEDEKVRKIIHSIELLFISPLPLIIIYAFRGYCEKIIMPSILHQDMDNRARIDNDKKNVLTDLGIIKYLFVSIIISTTFVVLIQIVFAINPGKEDILNGRNSTRINSIATQSMSTLHLNKIDSLKEDSIDYIPTKRFQNRLDTFPKLNYLDKLNNNGDENNFESVQGISLNVFIDKYMPVVAVSIILLILLLIYFGMLEKHLRKDMKEINAEVANLLEKNRVFDKCEDEEYKEFLKEMEKEEGHRTNKKNGGNMP